MYNEDLNKANNGNNANKGFMCKALPVVRYICLLYTSDAADE